MNRLLPRVLAVLLPLAVLAGGAALVAGFEARTSAEEVREQANAGRVMNGRRLNQGVVAAMEKGLDRAEPEVLVLGNSFANTNLDPKLLARELELPPKKVKVLSVPNSIGTHWYAILKNRVYARDHHPPLVIVLSNLQSALLVEPYSESSFANYTVQLDESEPVLDALVPRTTPWIAELRQQRGMVRDALLGSIRDRSIGLVYPSKTLRRDNERAMDRVFDDTKVDMARYKHALPVTETRGGMPGVDAVPHPRESVLPHLGPLATANGTRLVFVRSPMAPRTPLAEVDVVPEGYEALTREVLDETGHHFFDLSTLPLQDALFVNPGHMTDEGSRLFTRVVARLIRDQGLFGGASVPVTWRPAPPAIEVEPAVTDDPDDVAALFGGRWVAPGGRLVVRFDEGWMAPEAAWDLDLVMERFGPGPRPVVRVDGREVELEARPAGDGSARLRVDRPDAPPAGPWTVEVAVPEGGPRVLVQGLRVGRGAGARQVIGRAWSHEPARYDLFGELLLTDAGIRVGAPDARFAEPAPVVPRAGRRPTAAGRRPRTGVFEANDLKFLADAATLDLTPLGVRCSPVDVLEDGTPLPRPHEACAERPRIDGRVCHGGPKIVFSASDGAPVLDTGRRYSLALDPERDCFGGRWLYPSDRMTVRVGPEVLGRFREGARSLTLTAASAGGKPQTVAVVLRADGRELLRQSFVAESKPTTRILTFDAALWPGQEVELVLEHRGQGFVLVGSGVLAAGPAPR